MHTGWVCWTGDFTTLHAPPSLQPLGMLAYCSISILLFAYALSL